MAKCEFVQCPCQRRREAISEWKIPAAHPSRWARACETMDEILIGLQAHSDELREIAQKETPELTLGPSMERREL